jgi:hypothetical protein
MAHLCLFLTGRYLALRTWRLAGLFLPLVVRYHAYGILEYPLRGWLAQVMECSFARERILCIVDRRGIRIRGFLRQTTIGYDLHQ